MPKCTIQSLPNGLRLVAVEMPHLHSAELAVYLKVGGRNDTREKAGLAHFLEHMLFRGTADYATSLELETAFEAIGGSVNASTDEECTCYFSRIHPDHLPEGIKIFSSMLRRPLLSGLETERRIIVEEALEDINEQGEEINTHNLASRLMWPGHSLGMPTIGYLESIKTIEHQDIKGHLERYYTPSNAVVVVAGSVLPEVFFNACADEFNDWKGGAAGLNALAENSQQKPQIVTVNDSDSQIHLQVAFRGFPRHDRKIMSARLIRRILCGGGSSRLHLSLRERLGIVYSVEASISAYEETGAFAIELSTSPENLDQAVREVFNETMLLSKEIVPDDEFERVRNCYFFDLDYSRDSTYEMQVRYGWGELMGMVRSIDQDLAEASAIDPLELRRVAAELFAPRNLNLVAVGPLKTAIRRKVERQLKEYADAY